MRVQKNNKGFTLVEVLMAVAILAIVTIPLLANFLSSSKVNSQSREVMNGTVVAQNVMEGLTAYGAEKSIIQLEDSEASYVELKFLPAGMQAENWGRVKLALQSYTDASGVTRAVPTYAEDRYLEQDKSLLLQYKKDSVNGKIVLEDAMFTTKFSAQDVSSAFVPKYLELNTDGTIKRTKEGDAIFEADEDAHAYMFWLKNVSYGNKMFDVLVSFDGNNASMNPADYRSSGYNSVQLSKVANAHGTTAPVDDSTTDRYYSEPIDWTEQVAIEFIQNAGQLQSDANKKMVKENLERKIYINVKSEANPVDSSKPYTVITVQYIYHLLNASLLGGGAVIDTITKPEEEIFRSCDILPQNVYFYISSNYDTNGKPGSDNIYINNSAGEFDGVDQTGAEVNLYLIRTCDTTDTAVITNEQSYNINVELTEYIPSGEKKKTNICTNIDYNIGEDTPVRTGHSMGHYTLNGTPTTVRDLKIRNLSAHFIDPSPEDRNEDDNVYYVTVQIFRRDSDFDPDARIAKMTGSIN